MLSFFNYHRPSHWFSFWTHWCKPLIQHLVQLCKFRLLQCLSPEKALDTFTGCHKWS
jgi:hypothetical protein